MSQCLGKGFEYIVRNSFESWGIWGPRQDENAFFVSKKSSTDSLFVLQMVNFFRLLAGIIVRTKDI